MALKVIGTGFGRTGTDSMRKALNILGLGPTHHMHELGSPISQKLWLDLIKGGKPDWSLLFDGYHACVDWPSAFYWRALVNEYPESIVLLTMRPAESWWSSFEATILKYINNNDDPNSLAQLLVAEQVFDGRPADKEYAIEVYNQNIKDVISTVAPERLLIHNLGDGWDPLCKRLKLPTPSVDYPFGNTSRDFTRRLTG